MPVKRSLNIIRHNLVIFSIDELPKAGEKDIHGDFGGYCYIGFRHSLCHGWSAGVLRFMQEEL